MFVWHFRRMSNTEKVLAMSMDTIEGDWETVKVKAQEQWGKLTDENIVEIAGKRTELKTKLQDAYKLTRDQAERQIERFEKRNKDDIAAALLAQ
jgi:uncharacterized protein YjbJ (UPF0337 family)